MDEPFLVPIESGCQFNSEHGMWDIIFILLDPATMDTTSKNPDVGASFTETLTQLHSHFLRSNCVSWAPYHGYFKWDRKRNNTEPLISSPNDNNHLWASTL